MPRSNVVITGSGVVSAIGIGNEAYWDSLLKKRSGIQSLDARTDEGAKPGKELDPFGIWIGGPIVDFDPKQYVRPRKALKVMCREIQTAYAASQLAIEHAGLTDNLPADAAGNLKPDRIGTVFGSEMFYGPPTEMVDAIKNCMRSDGTVDGSRFGNQAMRDVTPLWMLKYLPNMPACHIGISLNALGPNNSLILGDVSGPAALIEAASCIDRGIADVMIAGASGTRINTTRMNYRGDLPVPSVYDPISASSRPHDPTASGVVGGEAAAALMLENERTATERGATPIAKLVSYAQRFAPSKGMHRALRSVRPDDEQCRGSATAIRNSITAALQDAELTSDHIGLVVSHGMGDPVMDAAEREALAATLPGVTLVAPIASLGHTGAASGTINLATAVLALSKMTIPPTLGGESTNGTVRFASQAEPLKQPYIVSLSHTPEGNAITIILG